MQVLQRRLWLWVVGMCALTALGSAATTPKVTFTDTKLKNGLRVLIAEDHVAPVFSIAVTYNAGSRDERKGRTGFAHLFEHMMFKGSERVGPGEHFMLVFNNGGSMNGTTNKDRTLYFETMPANQLDLALFLEADRMRSLEITRANLDNQRHAVQEERRLGVDNQPYGKTFEAIDELAYDNFAYEHSVIGSMDDLSAASVEDVASFFKTYYAPNNAVIAIVGDVKAADCLAKVRKYFESIPSQPAPPGRGHDGAAADGRATAHARRCAGAPAPSRHGLQDSAGDVGGRGCAVRARHRARRRPQLTSLRADRPPEAARVEHQRIRRHEPRAGTLPRQRHGRAQASRLRRSKPPSTRKSRRSRRARLPSGKWRRREPARAAVSSRTCRARSHAPSSSRSTRCSTTIPSLINTRAAEDCRGDRGGRPEGRAPVPDAREPHGGHYQSEDGKRASRREVCDAYTNAHHHRDRGGRRECDRASARRYPRGSRRRLRARRSSSEDQAPVSEEVLRVKLPRPQEATLSNGLHLMVLEDRRVPRITMQLHHSRRRRLLRSGRPAGARKRDLGHDARGDDDAIVRAALRAARDDCPPR